MMKIFLSSALMVMLLSLNACTTTSPGQDKLVAEAFNQTLLPEVWQSTKAQGAFDHQTLGFDVSPKLLALIKEAIAYNADLKMAVARIDQSRATLKAVDGNLMPNIGIGAQTGTSTIPTSTAAISGAGLIAFWDLDLWSKVRSDQSALQARLMSS